MEELRISLINAINESGLSIEAAVFVVRDVYRDVNETFRKWRKDLELYGRCRLKKIRYLTLKKIR